jgi:3-dehydroquinate synthetase
MSGEDESVLRQWISAPGGSCDVRVGAGLVGSCGHVLRTAVGKPRACALMSTDESDPDLVERLRRQLTDAGFFVHPVELPRGSEARTLASAGRTLEALGREGITSDDLVLATGDVDALSLAANVCCVWCGGVPLAAVPVDLDAMVEAAVTPRGLSVGDSDEMVTAGAFVRYMLCDPEVMDLAADGEKARLARALMVATAVAENENAFSRLWDRAEEIIAGDVELLLEQAVDTLKSRGHLVSSTALAVRQSIDYGQTFARAMARLVPGAERSTLLAEGLRFAARLSAGVGGLPVDDVLAQDELLDALGIGTLECVVDHGAMISALKEERFTRTNRFLLAVPQVIGRVRLTSFEDALLDEHARAWCAAHHPGE